MTRCTVSFASRPLVGAVVTALAVAASAICSGTPTSAFASEVFRSAPTARPATCPTGWGSLPKEVPWSTNERWWLTPYAVRSGRHACFDRVVFEMAVRSPGTSFTARYVPAAVSEWGGRAVPAGGGALLQIESYGRLVPVDYRPTREVLRTSGLDAVRGVWVVDHNRYVTATVIVTRGRLPFRMSIILGPGTHQRLVVDVAHHW